MNVIVKFPSIKNEKKTTPRRRVFFLGSRYFTTRFDQELCDLYLKRGGSTADTRYWSIITYYKIEGESGLRPVILEECQEKEVPDLLQSFDLQDDVSFKDLRNMGWKGVGYSAQIVRHDSQRT